MNTCERISSTNQRIKKIRTHLNLTQPEFGKKLGVTAAAISKIETGVREPSNQIILAICREFKVNETWLKLGHEPIFIETNESIISDFVAEYKLSPLSESILKAYVNIPELKRNVIDTAIISFAQEVLGLNNIESVAKKG